MMGKKLKRRKKAKRTGFVRWVHFQAGRSLVLVFQQLPVGVNFYFGRFAGWICWLVMPKRRAIVRRNLVIINDWVPATDGEPADPFIRSAPLERQVKEVFQRAGANIFSGLVFPRLSPEQINRHLELVNLEVIERIGKSGQGAVVLMAHMGPWEVVAQLPELSRQKGFDVAFGAMYRPLNNDYFDRWFREVRERKGTRFFSKKDGFHKPVDFLRSGGLLGVLADQKMRQGVEAPFFGEMAKTTPIPGLFHRRARVPIIALSIQTTGVARWRFSFSYVCSFDPEASHSREDLARVCNEALEHSLSSSVCDGFWMSRRF